MHIRRPQAALYCRFAFQRNVVMINRVGSVAHVVIASARLAMDMSALLPRFVGAELPILSFAIVKNGMSMKGFSGTLVKITCIPLCLPL